MRGAMHIFIIIAAIIGCPTLLILCLLAATIVIPLSALAALGAMGIIVAIITLSLTILIHS